MTPFFRLFFFAVEDIGQGITFQVDNFYVIMKSIKFLRDEIKRRTTFFKFTGHF